GRGVSKRALSGWLAPGTLLLGFGYFCEFHRAAGYLPGPLANWGQFASFLWSLALMAIFAGMLAWRKTERFRPERRVFLRAAGVSLCAAPLAATGFGILQRDRFELREIDIPIPNLPKDLHGFRMVQLSDIHLSPFLSEREFARAVDMASE